MIISQALAQTETAAPVALTSVPADAPPLPGAPSAGEALMWNIGLVLVLVAMFYVMLIMPQQRRFKEHSQMLAALKKGDEVITGGGLLGTIDKLVNDREVVVDLGNGMKVTALRSSIQTKIQPNLKS
jgi:preprotein translocase subunit YajC